MKPCSVAFAKITTEMLIKLYEITFKGLLFFIYAASGGAIGLRVKS